MPINTKHPEYNNWYGRWTKCRDVFSGGDIIKSKNTTYLPKLSSHTGEDDPKYKAYKYRALFLGAFQRTVEGLCGMATRKAYNLEASDNFKENIEEDMTTDGTHLSDLVKICVREMLITSRLGLLADHSGERPYVSYYPAENIINWHFEDGALEYVVLAEVGYERDPADKFTLVEVTKFRELFIATEKDENLVVGKAYSQMWKEDESTSKTTDKTYSKDGDPVALVKRGEGLEYIPFEFMNAKGTGAEIIKPLLLDLADVNLSHYVNSADYEHGLHFTALPTPWFSGISSTSFDTGEETEIEINIGSEKAVLLPDPSSSAGMLEFTGAGLASIKEAMNDKVNFMAMLGARILEPQKKGVEAADTAKMNQLGDTSILGSLVGSVESTLNDILYIFEEWGEVGEATIELNRDMMNLEMSPQMVTALLGALQASAISLDTFIYNMKVGELLPEDVSVDDEKEKISLRAPTGRIPVTPTGSPPTGSPPSGDVTE